MGLEIVFSIANSTALICWLFLFVFYQKRWVYRGLFSIVFPLMAFLYLFFILRGIGGESRGGVDSLANVKLLFSVDEAVLAGWIHYLVFDLFVGMWISQDADKKGVHRWMLLPCLLLTFMLGPAGLLLYFLIRSGFNRKLIQDPYAENLVH
uniref:ABA4-like family protein n=1 Tax=Algoriphagus sp. TaxID=1872435 RepID=UPI00258B647A|nr:ABA4-like family protein [Algoriphagus sp.]